jgi:uncharacterized protein (DUF1697 family)
MTGEKVYIALLRGINVGGNKVILMADLKKVFEESGFSNVKTYIQSGNIAFASEKENTTELGETIKAAIKDRFKFDVGVLVLGLDELEKIVKKNPFNENKLKADERIYLTILSKKPAKDKVPGLYRIRSDTDESELIDRAVYVLCRKGYSKSPFNNNSIERVLQVYATSRNLETMKKLVEIGKRTKA